MKGNEFCNGVNCETSTLKEVFVLLGELTELACWVGLGCYLVKHLIKRKAEKSREQDQQVITTEEETES